MTWHTSTVDGDIVIRETIFEHAAADLRFCFGLDDDTDAGLSGSGALFTQGRDFLMFESEILDAERAGPSSASPTRCYGALAITLFSKNPAKQITHRKQLEQIASWFSNKTLRSVRFRTFVPVSMSRLMGFASYAGVINFDFEMTQEQ